MMLVKSSLILTTLCLTTLGLAGCDNTPSATACTRDTDCLNGQKCSDGICTKVITQTDLGQIDTKPPAAEAGLVRWSRLDLDAVRAEKGAWRDAEGASFEGNVRPFSDRILGLLGWAPRSSAVAVERRQEGSRFRERIVFSSR